MFANFDRDLKMLKMNSVKQDLVKIFDMFRNKDGSDCDSYYPYLFVEGEDDKEISLEEKIEKIFEKHPEVTDWRFQTIGGFDSPGYALTCNSLAYTIDGKIYIESINYEFM